MKISIVIPYYNRKSLLLNVLKSIDYFDSSYSIETIIVDDGSSKEHQLYDLDFPRLNINLIVLQRDTTWRGACIAYNTGFKAATGDVILINSSECIHMGAIVEFVKFWLKSKTYLSFAAYQSRPETSFDSFDWETPIVPNRLKDLISPMDHWWRSHTTNFTLIPYCAAINRSDMELLGGYDERFVKGIGFDDYDFVDRVKNLGLATRLIDDPFVVHQHHKPTEFPNDYNLKLWQKIREENPGRIRTENNTIYV